MLAVGRRVRLRVIGFEGVSLVLAARIHGDLEVVPCRSGMVALRPIARRAVLTRVRWGALGLVGVRSTGDLGWGGWGFEQASEEPFGGRYVVQPHDSVPAKHFDCAVVCLAGHE